MAEEDVPLTLPTLELGDSIVDVIEDSVGIDFPGWGRLLPLRREFSLIDLEQPSISFGRGAEVDVVLHVGDPKISVALSKTHFRLIRDGATTYLIDLSSNGTFINGKKASKNKKTLLLNNSEISLALPTYKAYIYVERGGEDQTIPLELRQKFHITRELGRGAMGEVRLAFKRGSCERFAMKIIAKSKFTANGCHSMDVQKQVKRETEILKLPKHPCIISIHDVYDSPSFAYLLLEVVEGGELFDKIVASRRLAEKTAKLYCYQMLHAVKHLHDNGITHRDLKPENILLTSRENDETLLKITDFGLAKLIDSASVLKTFCGTPNYLAPEILATNGMGLYTEAVDLWSLGVILFVCLSGYPPFSPDYTDMSLNEQILKGRCKFEPKIWSNISSQAKDLVLKLLVTSPKERATADEALAHPWFQDLEVIGKARALMYPEADGMIPPMLQGRRSQSPTKKRTRAMADDAADETMDTSTPPKPKKVQTER